MNLSREWLLGLLSTGILTVVLVAGGTYLYNGSPQPSAVVSGLPSPEVPAVYHLETRIGLEGEDRTRTIRERFRIKSAGPGQLRITRRERHVLSDRDTRANTTTLSVTVDGNRYTVERNGVLLLAGETDSGPREAVDGLPGGSTYLVSQLTGRDPFISPVTTGSNGPGTILNNDTQTVRLDNGGLIQTASGPTKWTHYKFDPYYGIDYSETVTRVQSWEPARQRPIKVSDGALRVARAETGVRLPNHRFRTLDGTVRRLHEIEGPKLINQWASWCPPCIQEIPHLNDIHQRFGDRVTLLGVTNEKNQAVQQFLGDQSIDYQVLLQGTPTPVPYRNFRTLPFTFLVDGDHRLKAVISGPRTSDQWETLLEKYLLESEGT